MPKIHMTDWPPYGPTDSTRREGTISVAKLMANAAFTAPKSGGIPTIECSIAFGQEEQEEIAKKVEELSLDNPKFKQWHVICRSEAIMVREADGILFIGSTCAGETIFDVGCGLCGGSDGCNYFYSRKESKYGQVDTFAEATKKSHRMVRGPLCSQFVNDLGIAVGSATYLAAQMFVDARPIMSVGVAGQKLGYCPNSEIVVGIPVASLAKNPFVDIAPDYEYLNFKKVVKKLRKDYAVARQVHWFDYRNWYPKDKGKEE